MAYVFKKRSLGGGDGQIVDIKNSPPKEGKYYDIESYWRYGTETSEYRTLKEVMEMTGFASQISYYVVEELPEEPQITDFNTFAVGYVYIYQDIAYIYGDPGSGNNMWVPISQIYAQEGFVSDERGYTKDITKETETGLYVTYQEAKEGSAYRTIEEIPEGWVVMNGQLWSEEEYAQQQGVDITYYLVDSLPDNMNQSTSTALQIYLERETGEGYIYFEGEVLTAGSLIFGEHGFDRGWADSVEKIPLDKVGLYFVLNKKTKAIYVYENGVWSGGEGGGISVLDAAPILPNCYYKSAEGVYTLEDLLFQLAEIFFTLTYYVVDTLPAEPMVSTSEPVLHIYICNDEAFAFISESEGWLSVAEFLGGAVNRGYTENIDGETEDGVYVTYDKGDYEEGMIYKTGGVDADQLALVSVTKTGKTWLPNGLSDDGKSRMDLLTVDSLSPSGIAFLRQEGSLIIITAYILNSNGWVYMYDTAGHLMSEAVIAATGFRPCHGWVDEATANSIIPSEATAGIYSVGASQSYYYFYKNGVFSKLGELTPIETELKQANSTIAELTPEANFVKYASFEGTGVGEVRMTKFSGQVDSLIIPEGITQLAADLFDNNKFQTITFPASLKSTEGEVFSQTNGWPNQTNYNGTLEQWCQGEWTAALIGGRFSIGEEEVQELIIPDTITTIPKNRFNNCSSLTSVTVPDSVTSIGDSAFGDCPQLASVTIGNGVTSIGDGAFRNCPYLTSIKIPDGVTSIGAGAFKYCEGLRSITIPDSVTSIGQDAFQSCGAMDVYITDMAQWCAISFDGEYANPLSGGLYLNNVHVTELEIPGGVTSIGNYAFCHYNRLTSVTIPNSVTSIGIQAFYDCSNLTDIYVPWSEDEVAGAPWGATNATIHYNFTPTEGLAYTLSDDGTYYTCNGIGTATDTDITIDSNINGIPVTNINSNAFSSCTELTSVIIPNSVTSIGYSAFKRCSSLTSITLPFVGASEDGDTNTHFGYIFGAASYLDNHYHVPTTLKTVVITGGTSIGEDAFYQCGELTSVTIPDSVRTIDYGAFRSCTGLTSITIPDSVTRLRADAFSSCTGLTSVTIPNSVTYIDNSTFYGCSNLTSITIPDSVTDIGDGAFGNCPQLASVTIPDNVTWIGDWAFQNCSGLTSITIPDGVTNIGNEAFDGCTNLLDIYVPWAEGEVASAPWGASNATVHYNYTE